MNLKKIALFVSFLAISLTAFSQKYAYIDSDYILRSMPEYVEAQAELDRLATVWQKEIEQQFSTIDSMYKKYQVEAITLPANIKQKREQAIIDAENEAKELQKRRFGKDGDLFKKRAELVEPIQDRLFAVVEEFSKSRGYAFVFDAAGAMTIIYADSRWDINEEIMQKLGISSSGSEDEE